MITPWHIDKYKLQRKKIVKPATSNREIACLKHIFSMAIKWDKVNDNPVKKIKMFREDNRGLRYLNAEEISCLMDASPDHLRPILATALYTGMRKGEILNLKWEQVDLNNKVIHIYESKNSEGRDIPIDDTLTETLTSHKLKSPGKYVFGHPDGRPLVNVGDQFRNAVKRADIEHCRFHDLRHTFASHLVMAGVDLVIVKELLGHKTIKMTMRYSHLSQGHKRRAIEALSGKYVEMKKKPIDLNSRKSLV